jgi:hypothetical protein
MSGTPQRRQPHEWWRLTRADGTAVVLRFPGSVCEEDLRLLHPRFVSYEPVRNQATGQIAQCARADDEAAQ